MSQSVLLTGGKGFFGRCIASALKNHGYDVAEPGRPEFDLLDPVSVQKTLRALQPEIVVHSAAYYGGIGIINSEPAKVFHDNTLMLAHLLEASAKAGVKHFMSIGSACAYPGNVSGAMSESDYWSGRLHPSVEAYGFTKKIQEAGMRSYGKQYGMTSQMPIITNLYGEHDVFQEYRSHVAAALIKKVSDAKLGCKPEVLCWGTGSPVREFIYTEDAAEGVVRLLKSGHPDPLNIGTGVGTSIKELVELICELTGYEGNISWDPTKPDGVMHKVLDVSKMKEVLQWGPPTSLRDGLKKTIDWYSANKKEADSRS